MVGGGAGQFITSEVVASPKDGICHDMLQQLSMIDVKTDQVSPASRLTQIIKIAFGTRPVI